MKKLAWRLAVLAMFGVIVGCALTDYTGLANHKTTAESKLWGKEVAFSGFDPPIYNGTYSYTVKYDNTNGYNVVINSYQNEIVSSFNRDGIVDKDGDDVQGKPGELGGKFLPFFISVDTALGCGFFDNITYDKSPLGAMIALCFDGNADVVEEIDKDTFDLQAAFTDLDNMFKSIWTKQTGSPFGMDVQTIRLNHVDYNVSSFPLEIQHNGRRPRTVLISNSTGLQQAFQVILDHTGDMVPTNFGFSVAGGLTLDLPDSAQAGFNHAAIQGLLSPSGRANSLRPNLI